MMKIIYEVPGERTFAGARGVGGLGAIGFKLDCVDKIIVAKDLDSRYLVVECNTKPDLEELDKQIHRRIPTAKRNEKLLKKSDAAQKGYKDRKPGYRAMLFFDRETFV